MKHLIPIVSALLALSACGVPYGQLACLPSGEAQLILDDLAAGAGPSKLKRETAEPTKTTVNYEVAGRARVGELYTLGKAEAGVVLVPGASTSGKDDPRLIAFAASLARSHFAVLVPDMPNVRQLKVSPDDSRVIADAFAYGVTRADIAPNGRLGMGAFSYALGPTLIGALEPDIRDKVRFVLGVGGYHDLNRVITFFTTGFYRASPTAPWKFIAPNNYGKWAFVFSNVERFSDAEDKATLTEMANTKLVTPDANVDALVAKLKTAEAKNLYTLLTNKNPELVPGLVATLPEAMRKDLDALNLINRDLSPLKARLLLFHGYDDSLVPYTESVSLAAATGRRNRLFLISGFNHVDYGQPTFFDGWSFGCAINDLLDERWKGPADF